MTQPGQFCRVILRIYQVNNFEVYPIEFSRSEKSFGTFFLYKVIKKYFEKNHKFFFEFWHFGRIHLSQFKKVEFFFAVFFDIFFDNFESSLARHFSPH